MIKKIKIYVGPVSRNVAEAVIEFVNESQFPVGFTATLNHIGPNSYTGLDLKDIGNLPICRDHCNGRPNYETEKGFDIVHIDPWKDGNFYEAVERTIEWFDLPYFYEVGTEEAVYSYGAKELDVFLSLVNNKRIVYGVVQSGAKLQNGENAGKYNELKLIQTIDICKKHGVLSKEHNGDYLEDAIIKRKFELGLDAINMAPEFGSIESTTIWNALDEAGKDRFHSLCYNSFAWRKWVTYNFDFSNKLQLVKICGHYIFNSSSFKEEIKKKLPNIDGKIKEAIKDRLINVQTAIEEAV